MREYRLQYTVRDGGKGSNRAKAEHEIILYFCPNCGGRLQPSKRPDFFAVPSQRELKRLKGLLCGRKSVSEIRQVLGDPEKIERPNTPGTVGTCGTGQGVRRSLYYSNVAKTLQIIVDEFENGSIFVAFLPKAREKQSS